MAAPSEGQLRERKLFPYDRSFYSSSSFDTADKLCYFGLPGVCCPVYKWPLIFSFLRWISVTSSTSSSTVPCSFPGDKKRHTHHPPPLRNDAKTMQAASSTWYLVRKRVRVSQTVNAVCLLTNGMHLGGPRDWSANHLCPANVQGLGLTCCGTLGLPRDRFE